MQAAQTKHDEEVASHSTAYTTLYKEIVDFKKQLEQQAGSMACLQALLIQVQPLHILLFAIPFSPFDLRTDYAILLLSAEQKVGCLTGSHQFCNMW